MIFEEDIQKYLIEFISQEEDSSENMKRDLKDEQSGIAGFFLDVPVLLLVMIAITVFTAFFSQVYMRYEDQDERAEIDETCLEIKRDLKRYPEILQETEDGHRRGRFSVDKLEMLDNETLGSYLNVAEDRSFNVEIEDIEDEEIWIFGNEDRDELSSEDRSSYSIPILLVVEAEQPVVGRLSVIVW